MNRLGAIAVWLCLLGFASASVALDVFTPTEWALLLGALALGLMVMTLVSVGPVRAASALWHALVHRWHSDEGGRLFDQILEWATAARRGDFGDVAKRRRRARNRFARESLGLLDKHDSPVTLRLALEQSIRTGEDAALASARVFDAIAANASVAGVLAGSVALFVLAALGQGTTAAMAAGGLAFGLLVSLGVVLSGTVFRPLAARLRARGVRRGHDQARGMKGLIALLQRAHPQRVRVALYGDRCAIEV
ncbi:MAG: hypothetical protein AAGA11_03395 [Pseudomonadota bacterium]